MEMGNQYLGCPAPLSADDWPLDATLARVYNPSETPTTERIGSAMASGYELRRFMRSTVVAPVILTFGGGETVSGEILNLSIVGMFVRAGEQKDEGQECEASFTGGALKPIHVRCVVMHRKNDGMGLEITGISNTSFEYLRELIVSNADEPFKCDTEIMSNMGSLPALYDEVDT